MNRKTINRRTMNRRTWMKSSLAAGAGVALAQLPAQAQSQAGGGRVVHLFADMEVDAAREKEMLSHFHKEFVPEAKKHQGFIDVKLMKLHTVFNGPKYSYPYRFEIVFQNEGLRQKWIKTPGHERVWPPMEKMLTNAKFYPVYLYEEL
ncbi:MAG: hypothetical protein AB7O65_04070 [Candidatus Korobacteraceae bacterium]